MLFDDPEAKLQPAPGASAADWFSALMSAGIAAYPHWLAAPASVLFSVLTATVLSSRKDAWLNDLRLKLNELSEKVAGLTPEALSKNEEFITVLVQATQAANRTHESEIRESLANIVVRVAKTAVTQPTEATGPASQRAKADLELMFINMIDGFTPIHFEVLRMCLSATPEARDRMRKERDLSDQAIMDLLNRGLIKDTRALAARNRESNEALIVDRWDVSNLGRKFLKFIGDPNIP